MIKNSPTEYVSITRKWLFIMLSLLNLTKNNDVSDTKNNSAPITVSIDPNENPLNSL